MIQITPHMKILLAVEPIDFRKGIDAMARVCRQHLAADPFSGVVFVFKNRRGTALRILTFDGQGFWLCHKRLSSGKFHWWPKDAQEKVSLLEAHELQLLLWNGDPSNSAAAPAWRRLRLAA